EETPRGPGLSTRRRIVVDASLALRDRAPELRPPRDGGDAPPARAPGGSPRRRLGVAQRPPGRAGRRQLGVSLRSPPRPEAGRHEGHRALLRARDDARLPRRRDRPDPARRERVRPALPAAAP